MIRSTFKYDNYGAINVNEVAKIPKDYFGPMGVPITFLTKYNPEQFEIVGLGNSKHNFTPTKKYLDPKTHKKNGDIISGEAINNVLTIEKTEKPNKTFYSSESKRFLVAPYARVIIQRKEK